MSEDKETKKNPTPERVQRIWEHYRGEEDIFNNRFNFFLLVETVFLSGGISVITTLIDINTSMKKEFIILNLLFSVICLILTFLWFIILSKQEKVLSIVREQASVNLPEFKSTEEKIAEVHTLRSIRRMLVSVIPGVFFIIWWSNMLYSIMSF